MSRSTAPTLNETMKMIANDLIASKKITDVYFGTVTSISPLKIQIDQKHILTEAFLVLSNMVKDHDVDITVSMQTVDDNYLIPDHTHGNGNNGSSTTTTPNFDTTHHHDIKGKKKITFHYGLKLNEKVILLRMQGGKKYYVMDRVSDHICEGEWL